MNKSDFKTFGRGQALQRVMANSIANSNIVEMHMADYTNEKIMEFLGTLTQANEVGSSAQNLPSRSFAPTQEDKESKEECISFDGEGQWKNTEPFTTVKPDSVHKDHCMPTSKIITGQFIFKEEDFPPL